MLKKILPLVLMFAGFQANAALIDNVAYTTDNVSNLDWLDLSATAGMTLEEAQAANPGWYLATKAEYTGLIGQFGLDTGLLADVCDASPTDTSFFQSCPSSDPGAVLDNAFFSLFGQTGGLSIFGNRLRYSFGFYNDVDTPRAFGGVSADSSADLLTNTISVYNNDVATIDPTSILGLGQFLVRPTTVPEPSIIALFAAGLFGIGFARRRKHS